MRWRLDDRRSKDSSVTLSVVIEQMFHEKTNKLRTLKKCFALKGSREMRGAFERYCGVFVFFIGQITACLDADRKSLGAGRTIAAQSLRTRKRMGPRAHVEELARSVGVRCVQLR